MCELCSTNFAHGDSQEGLVSLNEGNRNLVWVVTRKNKPELILVNLGKRFSSLAIARLVFLPIGEIWNLVWCL